MDEHLVPTEDTAADSEQQAPGDLAELVDIDDIDAREAARIHRRDHDAEAHRRELLRPGMGKVFKQITDSWGEKASRDHDHARKTTRHDS